MKTPLLTSFSPKGAVRVRVGELGESAKGEEEKETGRAGAVGSTALHTGRPCGSERNRKRAAEGLGWEAGDGESKRDRRKKKNK